MPDMNVAGNRYYYDKPPDYCPRCHHGIKAIEIGSNIVNRRETYVGSVLQILYRCPRDECQRAFIATYWQDRGYTTDYPGGDYLLRDIEPYSAEEPDTPAEIKELSPNYHTILGQSNTAAEFRLDQISGCGYRKALEFLIKDYAIHKHPDDAEVIKSKPLGFCIKEYVADANVKACAARAAWLGNDEIHYVRKWTEKDIDDLKILLRLTSAWILNALLTEKYLREMQ